MIDPKEDPIYEITDGRLAATYDGESFTLRVVDGEASRAELDDVSKMLELERRRVVAKYCGPACGDEWSFICFGVAFDMGWSFIVPDLDDADDQVEERVY